MTSEFHVLQEFTAHVKGMGYLTAGVLLLGFIAYWKYISGKPKRTTGKSAGAPHP